MSERDRKPRDPDLRAFLQGAGQSLSLAGNALTEGTGLSSQLVIASVEVEARVAMEADASGALRVHPVSVRDLESKISAAALSTLRVQYVAADSGPPESIVHTPTRNPREVIAEVRGHADIARLEAILGKIQITPTFVAESGHWLVTVTDPEGRPVREIVLPDEGRE